ncbi:MAG: hypothetical protein ACSW8F_06410, partial [bacterium]
EALTQAFYKASEKLYQAANPQQGGAQGFDPSQFQGGQQGGQQNGGQGGYYDADYEVVDDDNNKK